MRTTQERLAGLFDVLNHAASSAAELAAYLNELIERRAHYTRIIAEHLAEIGGLREDVTVQTAADVLFALNSSEFFLLLARDRDWQSAVFEHWLADAPEAVAHPTPQPLNRRATRTCLRVATGISTAAVAHLQRAERDADPRRRRRHSDISTAGAATCRSRRDPTRATE
ncbi:MAG TPA: hypothetical protein VGI50_00565 [Solirubrobacteraceae bacterium]|jgi:hypothetical protein